MALRNAISSRPAAIIRGFDPRIRLAAIAFDRQLSPSDVEDFLRRPQRPGIPRRAMTRLWKPSSDSPSRITGNRQPISNSWQRFQDIRVCTGGTLLERRNSRNRKFMLNCAEAVEDKSSLWKEKEKPGRIMTTSDFLCQNDGRDRSRPILLSSFYFLPSP
jgi:hypothetical protein